MGKFFNCSGPSVAEKHYMVDPCERLGNIRQMIQEARYFLIHAPYRTGKSTNMEHFAKQLNKEGDYLALYINIEKDHDPEQHVEIVNEMIVNHLKDAAATQLSDEFQPQAKCFEIPDKKESVIHFLKNWCHELIKPLVLIIDEIDTLAGKALNSILHQFREGYKGHPTGFPHAICLIGMKDVRNRKTALNIKEESIRLAYFTFDQIQELYLQHTEATGQRFEEEGLKKIHEATKGHPWLVNAIGQELCFGEKAVPHDQTVTVQQVDQAIETLITQKQIHPSSLKSILNEPLVADILKAILSKEKVDTDQEFVLEKVKELIDFGLIQQGKSGFEIVNPIFKKIIPELIP